MKVAHIVPPNALLDVEDLFDDYMLLLPNLLHRSRGYRGWARDFEGFKILDNGVAEGQSYSFDVLLQMGRLAKVNEVVLPDVMCSMDETLRAVAKVSWIAFDYRREFGFMFVVQGQNVSECVHSAQRAFNMFGNTISSFGIPRHILSQGIASRAGIAQRLRREFPRKELHLLGMHPTFSSELKLYMPIFRRLEVRGVDSSLAWNAVLNGPQSLSYNQTIKRQAIGAFRTAHPTDEQIAQLRKNMEVISQWTK